MMKGKWKNILLVILFLAGLSLMLYPGISNYWNSLHQSQVIVDYADQLNELEESVYRELWDAADRHNQALAGRGNQYSLPEEQEEAYWSMLDPNEMGVMAYIEIPIIDVTLPIGHGTEEDVLQKSVGHLEWSSLPIGGESTHCVLSGHRGLPSSELFTNIDQLEPGDVFYIHVLGETLTYEVDNVAVVEPDDHSLLGIEAGKDYVTLVTCTPYGINTHRLLIRGVRAEEFGADGTGIVPVDNEVSNIDLMVVLPVTLAILAVIVFLVVLLEGNRRPKGKRVKGGRYEER